MTSKERLFGHHVHCMFSFSRIRIDAATRAVMADQIVITEKSSQAKDVRAAVGSRYGDILPAEGHLFDLLEPEDVVPEWKRWSPILLRPEGLYGTRPAEGGNKAAKLKAIREALRTAKRVWLATDCDREGQLIGQEILEHYEYRGQVMRVLFTAQDQQTIRDAFGRAKPKSEYANLYAAAVARRQADQKRQGPPKLHALPSMQKLCGSRFGWPASKTLEVAQELYDGQGKKIITYPRAEVRYLPQSLISDVPKIVAGLQVGQSFSAIP